MHSFFPCMVHLTFAIPFSQMQCRDVVFSRHSSMCLLTTTLQHQRSRPLPDRIEVLLMMIRDILGPTTSGRISMSVAFVCMLNTWTVSRATLAAAVIVRAGLDVIPFIRLYQVEPPCPVGDAYSRSVRASYLATVQHVKPWHRRNCWSRPL